MACPADGIRTEKTVNGVTHKYTLNGTQIVRETITDSTGTYIEKDLRYFYDSQGHPAAFHYTAYNSAGEVSLRGIYHLATNAQGDVIGIYNSSGELLYTYVYDAWGYTLISQGLTHISNINPFRYRGYYLDFETNCYYLNSRYFSRDWNRFLNADDVNVVTATPDALTDKNLYAYCDNNPVMRADENGEFWEAIAIGFAAGVISQYVSDVIGNIQDGKAGMDIFTPTSSAKDYLASGFGGAIAAIPGLNLVGTMLVGAVGNIVTEGMKGNINSWQDMGKVALKGAVANGIGYGVAKGMAALKVSKISNMPRTAKKAYLQKNIFKNSHKYTNQNLKIFTNNSFSANMALIESQLTIFRSGIYSTVTSTIFVSF